MFIVFCSYRIMGHRHTIELINNNVSCRWLDHDLGFARIKKNCDGERGLGGAPVKIHFNSEGFRDQERTPVPAPGAIRIALLGGSLLVGPGLAEDHNPARLLEKELRRRGLSDAEVLNLSVEGFTTTQQAIFLPGNLKRFSPHVVLLMTMDGFKPFRDLVFENRVIRGEDRYPIRLNTNGPEIIKASLNSVIHFKKTFHLTAIGDELELAKALMGPALRLASDMNRLCDQSGTKLIVVWSGEDLTNERAIPWVDRKLNGVLDALLPELIVPADLARGVIENRGLDLVNLAGRLPAHSSRDYFINNTRYYSEAGMVVYARELAELLMPKLQNIIKQRKYKK